MRLNLGVLDIAYAGANGKSGAQTTGDVAELLEQKYSVMETFFESRKEKISEWLAEAIADEIADLFAGKRPNSDPFMAAMQNTETEFRAFLDANEMAHLVAGLSEGEAAAFGPVSFTGAGNRGVNHRKKKPYAKENKARPAFVDTGLFQASFRSWISKTDTE